MNERLDLIRARFAAVEPVEPLPEDRNPAPREDESRAAEPEAPDEPTPPEGSSADCARYPLNDIGNGQRFVRYFGEDVKRVSRVGWFVWNGKVWAEDEDDQRGFSADVRKKAHLVSAWMQLEEPHIPIPKGDQPLLEHLDQLERDPVEAEGADEPDRTSITRLRRQIEAGKAARKRRSDRCGEHLKFAKSTGNSAKLDAMLKEGSVALNRTLTSSTRIRSSSPATTACWPSARCRKRAWAGSRASICARTTATT